MICAFDLQVPGTEVGRTLCTCLNHTLFTNTLAQHRYDSSGQMAGLTPDQQQATIRSAPDEGLQADVWLSITQNMPAPVSCVRVLDTRSGLHVHMRVVL